MKNKSILITGGNSGIGFATAKLLKQDGARLLITGRSDSALAEARRNLGDDVVTIRSDSASLADAKQLGAQVKQHTAQLDGVFFNAGIGRFASFETATDAEFEEQFSTNVRGPYFQLQSLLPLLANPSSVVFNASIVVELGFPQTSAYSATKAAVVSLTKTLAVELAARGIRVNALNPGPIETPIFDKVGIPAEARQGTVDHMASLTLLKRLGRPEEVAELARFLLSPKSSFITGTDVAIDGGIRLT